MAKGTAERDHLRNQYDAAFQTWASEFHQVQQLRAEGKNIDGADARLAEAEARYRQSRDRLIEELVCAACA